MEALVTYHVMILCMSMTSLTLADTFHCDPEHFPPIPSYLYTCDNVPQCLDGADERGCMECTSGRLLLSGIPSDHTSMEYEAVFIVQDYKLLNRHVYKTESRPLGYITYNDTSHSWTISKLVDRFPLLVSEPTYLSIPYESGLKWNWLYDYAADPLPADDVHLRCIPEDVKKCFGNLILVTPVIDLVLIPQSEQSNNRAVYRTSDGSFTLQFVLSSTDWAIPHWQVMGTEEAVVFLDPALSPEFTITPGVYKAEQGDWIKGSNVYVVCQRLGDESTVHPLDCSFQQDTCSWTKYVNSDFDMTVGAAELYTVGERIKPSLFVKANQDTSPGKYKLKSPSFDVDTESCMLLTVASTVYVTDVENPNITVTSKNATSATVVWSLTECTHIGDTTCIELQYNLYKVDLVIGQNFRIEITVELGLSQQQSGVISLQEIGVFEGSCAEVNTPDPCMEWPCGSGECYTSGIKTYQCQCIEDDFGGQCADTYSCQKGFVRPDNADQLVPNGNMYVYTTCLEGYDVTGGPAVCLRDGTWSPLQTCVKRDCTDIDITNGDLDRSSGITAHITCHENHVLVGSRDVITCLLGEWDLAEEEHPVCLLDCSFPNPREIQLPPGPFFVVVTTCEYAANAYLSNHTFCSSANFTVDGTGYTEVAPDIQVELDNKGSMCVRYGEGGLCRTLCTSINIVRIVRTITDLRQSVDVVSSFSWTDTVIGAAVRPYSLYWLYMCLVLWLYVG